MKTCKNCGYRYHNTKYLYMVSDDYCYECNMAINEALNKRKNIYCIDAIKIIDEDIIKVISKKINAFEEYFILTGKYKFRENYSLTRNYPSLSNQHFIKEYHIDGKKYVKDKDNNIYEICLIDSVKNSTIEISDELSNDDLFIIHNSK